TDVSAVSIVQSSPLLDHSVSLGGTYSSNLMIGNVRASLVGGSLSATEASLSALDDALLTAKSDLAARTVSQVFPSSGLGIGASIAFNAMAGSALSEAELGVTA